MGWHDHHVSGAVIIRKGILSALPQKEHQVIHAQLAAERLQAGHLGVFHLRGQIRVAANDGKIMRATGDDAIFI